ncbi:MAG: RdgB/HAM1 family non-canonical purine NTP pyrophosphatase [Candidatus Aminicenantes bacterium]|nr:RdgB/HAM1 family non-canonical purine NTP pyrophosphatase [Candidatus Aminicenantes bacterium]
MNERRLIVATTNRGKWEEIRSLLQQCPISVLSLRDLPATEIHRETGQTFAENARGKAVYYDGGPDTLTLGEDSGLEIEALNNRPGLFSARFAGPDASDEDNIQKVLQLMKGIPNAERSARFVSCLALAENGRIIREFRGVAKGQILRRRKGKSGFGYDPIFFYPPLNKTFAELGLEEKNAVSHRGQALRALLSYLTPVVEDV